MERFGLKPDECIFVDDTVRNVVMSKTYGMKGIAFTDTNDTINKLREFGVNV